MVADELKRNLNLSKYFQPVTASGQFDYSTLPTDTDKTEMKEFDGEEPIHAKSIIDGANTLTEAAQQLRAFADELVDWEKQGWQLIGPVENGSGWLSQDTERE